MMISLKLTDDEICDISHNIIYDDVSDGVVRDIIFHDFKYLIRPELMEQISIFESNPIGLWCQYRRLELGLMVALDSENELDMLSLYFIPNIEIVYKYFSNPFGFKYESIYNDDDPFELWDEDSISDYLISEFGDHISHEFGIDLKNGEYIVSIRDVKRADGKIILDLEIEVIT